MLITPKISNDSAASESQANSTNTRRSAESQNSPTTGVAAAFSTPTALSIQTNVSAVGGSEGADFDSDDLTSHAADHLMNSLRTGILAQPAAAMLAQASLPPQSVYDLLR